MPFDLKARRSRPSPEGANVCGGCVIAYIDRAISAIQRPCSVKTPRHFIESASRLFSRHVRYAMSSEPGGTFAQNLRTSGLHAACSSGVPDIAQAIEEQLTNVSVRSILRNIMMSISL
jgi:hypothetical protein